MRKITTLIAVIIIDIVAVVLYGCGSDVKLKEYEMDFNVLSTNTIISIPLDIAVKGDSLLVNQYFGDKFLVWLSLKDGSLIKTDISKGNGRREMQGPLSVNSFSDSLLIYDRQRFGLYKTDFMCDSIITAIERLPFWTTKVFPFKNGNMLVSKIPFGVEDAEIADTRFAIMRGDSVLSHFGDYPRLSNSDKESDSEELANSHQILGFQELPDNEFAVVSSHVLSLYSASEDGYVLKKEVAVAPYEYNTRAATQNQSAMSSLKEGESIGVPIGLAYHSGKIYLPFQETEDDDIVIMCYDMDLNLVGTIKPAVSIMPPFVIDDNGRIVALSENDKETSIVVSTTSVDDI